MAYAYPNAHPCTTPHPCLYCACHAPNSAASAPPQTPAYNAPTPTCTTIPATPCAPHKPTPTTNRYASIVHLHVFNVVHSLVVLVVEHSIFIFRTIV